MWFKLSVLAVFAAIFSGIIYQNNPVLFGTPGKKGFTFYDHSVYEYYPHLDDELFPLAFAIDRDFGAYRNHCLRVLTFTKYFLPTSAEEELPDAMDLAATAIAYLNIGLWTGQSLNYIESSKEKLESSLGNTFSPQEMNILREIILQQKTITDYKGLSSDAANALVNAVRKASWTDTTMGVLRFDLPSSLLETAYDELEGAGFHAVFLRRFATLLPNIPSGVMEAIETAKQQLPSSLIEAFERAKQQFTVGKVIEKFI